MWATRINPIRKTPEIPGVFWFEKLEVITG
jgi:hypothetical protein